MNKQLGESLQRFLRDRDEASALELLRAARVEKAVAVECLLFVAEDAANLARTKEMLAGLGGTYPGKLRPSRHSLLMAEGGIA